MSFEFVGFADVELFNLEFGILRIQNSKFKTHNS